MICLAKEATVHGDGFDRLEKEINEKVPMLNSGGLVMNKSVPQQQLNHLLNLYHQGHMQKVIEQSAQMLKDFPKSASVYNLQGAANKSLQRLDDAIDSYKMAISIKPDFAEAYNNMAVALRAKGEANSAIKYLKLALNLVPTFADAFYNMGNALQDLGDIDKALDSFEQAIIADRKHFRAYNNIGLILQAKGSLQDAEKNHRASIKINPNNAELHNNLGNALKAKGDNLKAVKSYQKAVEISSSYAGAYYNLAITLQEIGQHKECLVALDAALKLFIKDPNQVNKIQAYKLRSLYALNKKSQFYENLADMISSGQNNALIGSLCCRANLKYGEQFQNSFCNDPMAYVWESSLLELCDFDDLFVKGAEKILKLDKVSRRQQDLLINGYQTAGNLFETDMPFLKVIKEVITIEIEKYLQTFATSSEGIISDWPQSYFLNGWIVGYKTGGAIRPHIHEMGWLSGSIYINVPKPNENNSGNLVVGLQDSSSACDGTDEHEKIIQVNTGSFCLFPSSLLHYTLPFESSEDRVVLAFDVIPRAL